VARRTLQHPCLDGVEGDGAGRASLAAFEERLLSQAVARAEHGQRRHVAAACRHADRHVPLLDHVQGLARVALVEQRVVLAVRAPRDLRHDAAPVVW
jgi:hypothetical protein